MKGIPKPPYAYEADQSYSFYLVRESGIRGLVNPGFRILSLFGWTLLIVAMVKYRKASSLSQPGHDFAYDELMLACPVRHRLKLGFTTFMLYLNNETGVSTGRIFYGFPKSYADFSISAEGGRLTLTCRKKELACIRVLGGFGHAIACMLYPASRLVLRRFSIILNRDGSLVKARFRMAGFGLRIGNVAKADFRPLTGMALPSGKPFFTVMLYGSRFRMERPLVR